MRLLYDPTVPFAVDRLDCGDGHKIYVEQAGNPTGIPVLFLHGGPGSGCNENHRRYFNPAIYRVVLFDQRGSNRSTPEGEVRNNTTQLLLQDMESIRIHCGVEQWLLFGGSWGSTLALLYAQANPRRVRGMILRGIFLARERDLHWFAHDGVSRIFPDEWDRFLSAMTPEERRNPIDACQRHVLGSDPLLRERYALAWSRWAGQVATWLLPEAPPAEPDVETIVQQARIEMHYAQHRYFLSENQILDNAAGIPGVPIRIIHGRRDLTCTLDAAWSLHGKITGAELIIVRDGGHLASEPAMVDALVTATNSMADRLR
jgi:proline iminopeptidase